MIKLNTSRILVPFDFSQTSKKALSHAASLAQLTKGELQLLYVRKPESLVSLGHTKAELRRMAEESENYKKIMDSTAEEIRSKYKIHVTSLVHVGKRITSILKTCEKNEVGLIVMGTEGSDSVSNLFSGSNSHKIVSKSEIPVITVRSETQKEGYSNVLVPVDLSEHTRQKMIVAIQIAKMFSSTIHLLGILEKEDKTYEGKLAAILRQIEKRLESAGISYTCEVIKTEKAVSRTLSIAKRKNADMIITMTDQGTSASLFNRSYDHELVEESTIPVLSVPPEIHNENIEATSLSGI